MSKGQEIRETISDILIATLLSHRSAKSFRMIMDKLEKSRHKEKSFQVALTRLNKKGYVSNSKVGWVLTSKGKEYWRENILLSYIPSPFKDSDYRKTIVSFDIPGPQRKKRDWLRNQLKIFDYKMLQQSLWLGPGPLPKEFLNRLHELKIKENIKIFNITN